MCPFWATLFRDEKLGFFRSYYNTQNNETFNSYSTAAATSPFNFDSRCLNSSASITSF